MNNNKNKLPKSVTVGWICFAGLIGFMISLKYIRQHNFENNIGAIVAGLYYILPVIVLEWIFLKIYKRPSTGLNFKKKNTLSFERVLIKLVGLYATLSLVALLYWLLPIYHSSEFSNYWILVKYLLLIIVFGSIPYFFILDSYLIDPETSYWKVGMIVTGNWKEINKEGLKNHFLGWLVKAFFLPLMYNGLSGNIGFLKERPFIDILAQADFRTFFDYALTYIYTIDLVVVFTGYIMTLRIFDSHIRTVEPSFFGWYVALQCYQPFWSALSGHYFNYSSGYEWHMWLNESPIIFTIWGTIILILVAVYSWASLYFGIRFSNLTNRGIITNGPYRFMRHPAYISKNISWWMISIPFISQAGFFVALQQCLLLLLVNTLYYFRAKTEERHLSQDPTYVQYAQAINEIGIFRKLSKFSFLRYNNKNQ